MYEVMNSSMAVLLVYIWPKDRTMELPNVLYSMYDMGWPDLLSKLAVVKMMMIDNLVLPMISPC